MSVPSARLMRRPRMKDIHLISSADPDGGLTARQPGTSTQPIAQIVEITCAHPEHEESLPCRTLATTEPSSATLPATPGSSPTRTAAEVANTGAARVRDVVHNFNADGFDSLYPRYSGGRPRTFTLPERRQIKKIAVSKPAEHGLPFSAWSLSKPVGFLAAWWPATSSTRWRTLLRQEGVSFQKVKTWKASKDPDYAAKKARTGRLYAVADARFRPVRGIRTR